MDRINNESVYDGNTRRRDLIFNDENSDEIEIDSEEEELDELIESRIDSFRYYHLSQSPDLKVMNPRIPDNYFTKNNFEDGKTPRVCFCPSIQQCLMALSMKCVGEELYVYTPYNIDLNKAHKATTAEVPDAAITGEVWFTEPVRVKCVGKIKVLSDTDKEYPYKYGNNTASLYEWKYKQIFNELESTKIPMMEEANYTEENSYPVFIILMHTGTPLSNTIKVATGAKYTHSCISFNPQLDPMYSFGNKKVLGGYNDAGFVIQNPNSKFWKHYEARYAVYVMYVDKIAYENMQHSLQYFIKHKNEIKFDIPNLISCWLGIPSEKSEKYFCSRFVAEIINSGNRLAKAPSLYKPNDLAYLENISLVNRGKDFKHYDPAKTMRNLEYVKVHDFESIRESAEYNDKPVYDNTNGITSDNSIEFDLPTPAIYKPDVQTLLDNTDPSHIYLTSDWHLFKNHYKKEANYVNTREIIQWCYKNIKPDDVFMYLGDISFRYADLIDQDESQKILKKIPGHKILILGNHDKMLGPDYFTGCGFDYVFEDLTWKDYIFTHKPVRMDTYPENMINIHGHIHNIKTYNTCDGKRNVNVYPMFYNNKPVTLKYLADYWQDLVKDNKWNPNYGYGEAQYYINNYGNNKTTGFNIFSEIAQTQKPKPIVYFSPVVDSKTIAYMVSLFQDRLGANTAIKLHFGESGNQNFLNPKLLKDLVKYTNADLVDSNTAYAGSTRGNTPDHIKTAMDHGFGDIGHINILDTDGDIKLSVPGRYQIQNELQKLAQGQPGYRSIVFQGRHLDEISVGSRIKNYDSMIVYTHFKGHNMAGYGGAIKNIGMGIPSGKIGKRQIHGEDWSSGPLFLERLVESASAIQSLFKDRIVYINVLQNMSTECNCDKNAPRATIPNIGVLVSDDIVAIEQASIDFVRVCPKNKDLMEQIASKAGYLQIEYANWLHMGSKNYILRDLSNQRIKLENTILESDISLKPGIEIGDLTPFNITPEYLKKNRNCGLSSMRDISPCDDKWKSKAFEYDGQVVACVSVYHAKSDKDKEKYGDYYWINNLEVDKRCRNRGIGTQLLDYAVKYMKGNALICKASNTTAKKIYDKYGFKVGDDTEVNPNTGKVEYYQMYLNPPKINNDSIEEAMIFNKPDIYYKKKEFETGEINIAFILGQSGSGKSTMGNKYAGDKVDWFQLDDVMANYNFSDGNLKEYGDMIYSFFKGPGSKYRYDSRDAFIHEYKGSPIRRFEEYDVGVTKAFLNYSQLYAASHRDRKFIIEGCEIYWSVNPSYIDDGKSAVFIKGTSALISHLRAAKRDSEGWGKMEPIKLALDIPRIKMHWLDEKKIENYRKYYTKKIKESKYVHENLVINRKDILYHKKEFEEGFINLAFIVGFSGSGKSTMADDMAKKYGIRYEHIELDDLVLNWNFSDDELKEKSSMMYSFLTTTGRKYRVSYKELVDKNIDEDHYEKPLVHDFIEFAKSFANSHKNTRFAVEGIWLIMFEVQPYELKDYAVFIKGTSYLTSDIRASKRDASDYHGKNKNLVVLKNFLRNQTPDRFKRVTSKMDKGINDYYNYFKDRMKKEGEIMQEAKRSELPDSSFGIPEDRKFPLDTEQHVRSAIKLFGHAEESKKKSLARRIRAAAKKYDISIPETTQCYKYLNESAEDIIPSGINNMILCQTEDGFINIPMNDIHMWYLSDGKNPSNVDDILYCSSLDEAVAKVLNECEQSNTSNPFDNGNLYLHKYVFISNNSLDQASADENTSELVYVGEINIFEAGAYEWDIQMPVKKVGLTLEPLKEWSMSANMPVIGMNKPFIVRTDGSSDLKLVTDIGSDKCAFVNDDGNLEVGSINPDSITEAYQFIGNEAYLHRLNKFYKESTKVNNLYSALTGKPMLTEDQIDFDSSFKKIDFDLLEQKAESEFATLRDQIMNANGVKLDYFRPTLVSADSFTESANSSIDYYTAPSFVNKYNTLKDISIREDFNGVYFYSDLTGKRSASVSSTSMLTENMLKSIL